MDRAAEPLLRSVVAWAEGRPDVRAVVMTGSRSAEAGTGDAVQDFDVDLLVDDPGAFGDDDWLERIAPVLVASEDEEDGDPVRLVFFSAQRKVEFRLRDAGRATSGDARGDVLFARTADDRDAADPGGTGGAPGPAGPQGAGRARRAPGAVDRDAAAPEAPPRAVLRAVVPVFTAPDVPDLLRHYRALGFDVQTEDDGTGVVVRDGLVLRVAPDPDGSPAARGLVRALVDDPARLAREWGAVASGRTTGPADPGRPEWAHADPAGNVIRILAFPGRA